MKNFRSLLTAAALLSALACSPKIVLVKVQEPEPFIANNSGHGMLFRTFGGNLIYVVHHSEGDGPRKPQYWEVDDSGDTLVLGERIMVDEIFNIK